jgi:hypothetical protein
VSETQQRDVIDAVRRINVMAFESPRSEIASRISQYETAARMAGERAAGH